MSFSLNIKNELAGNLSNARHCRIAELAAIAVLVGQYTETNELVIRSENEAVISKFADIYRKLSGNSTVNERNFEKRGAKITWLLNLTQNETAQLLEIIKAGPELIPGAVVYQQSCCKRAFLRGAFLACGSISDPEKDYHLEFVTADDNHAGIITSVMTAFDIEAKIIHRKHNSVVYLKDGECIVDLLNVMEAHVGLMELENVRILKEMRNSVNRRVNCEAANIDKTVKAARKQIDDIEYLRNTIGLDGLSDDLRATAVLRLEYPESSLSELGTLHERPVGRSGVNHRLQKLSDMAARLRSGKPVYEKTED